MQEPAQKLTPGNIVDDRYEIIQRLGAGGMGTVYKALEHGLERTVALKFLHQQFVEDDDSLRRFEQEGKILAGLVHVNVMRCYRFGIWADRLPYLVMEFVEGKTLRQILSERSDPLSVKESLELMIRICDGLIAAHNQGILHRDLKPENVFVEAQTDIPKILDFGLAKDSTSQQKNTKTGELVGSVKYMSPEQCLGHKADKRSDVYGLACILFEMLTGHALFEAENPVAFLNLHANAKRPLLSEKCPDRQFPETLQNILNKGLAIDPSQRYQTVDDFQLDLNLLAQGQPDVAVPAASCSSTKRIKAGVFLFLTLAILLIVFLLGDPSLYERADALITCRKATSLALIENKLETLLSKGDVACAELYLQELALRLTSPDAAELKRVLSIASGFEKSGRQDLARRLYMFALRSSKRYMEKSGLLPAQIQEMGLIQLQILSKYPHHKEYGSVINKLFNLGFEHHSDLDSELCLIVANKKLKLLESSEGFSPVDLIIAKKLRLLALGRNPAKAKELLEAGNELLIDVRALRKENCSLYADVLLDVAGVYPPVLSEALYKEALALENSQISSLRRGEAILALAERQSILGKHKKALETLHEAAICLSPIEEDNRRLSRLLNAKHARISRAPDTFLINYQFLLSQEQAALGNLTESRLEFDRLLRVIKDVLKQSTSASPYLGDQIIVMFAGANRIGVAEKCETIFTQYLSLANKQYPDFELAPKSIGKVDRTFRNWLGIKWAFNRVLKRKPNSGDWPLINNLLEENELSSAEILKNLAHTDEFKNDLKKLGPSDKIEELYLRLLGRQSDPIGKKYWLSEFTKEHQIDQITDSFLVQEEFIRRSKEQMDIDALVLVADNH